jgi:hypothetical protein
MKKSSSNFWSRVWISFVIPCRLKNRSNALSGVTLKLPSDSQGTLTVRAGGCRLGPPAKRKASYSVPSKTLDTLWPGTNSPSGPVNCLNTSFCLARRQRSNNKITTAVRMPVNRAVNMSVGNSSGLCARPAPRKFTPRSIGLRAREEEKAVGPRGSPKAFRRTRRRAAGASYLRSSMARSSPESGFSGSAK